MVKVLGLTGGIASGKSTVAQLFKEWGAEVIDADQIVHQLLLPGHQGFKNILETFGTDFVQTNGRLDTKKLGNLIFTNPQAKEQLDRLNNQLIREQISLAISEAKQGPARLIVAEIPLLFEQHYQIMCDGILVVDVNPEIQLQRLMTRNKISKEQANSRILSQLGRQNRVEQSDFYLDNSGDGFKLRLNFKELINTSRFQKFLSNSI